MSKKLIVFLSLVVAVPLFAQVQPSASGTPPEVYDDVKMSIPPPVAGEAYPNVTGDETRTNYVAGEVTFVTAYDDNVFAGNTTKPVSDTTFTVLPTVSYDRTEPRQNVSFEYSPGFTFYDPTSQLNAIDQNAKGNYTYRFSPYTAININDTFLQTTNLLGQPGALNSGGVTGAAGNAGQTIILPNAEIVSNNLTGSATKQFARNQMFGLGGDFGVLNYPNLNASQGVFNSRSAGGKGFYAQRFSLSNYFGVMYDYTRITAYPPQATNVAQTHNISPFFTWFSGRTTSISVAAGPEYYSVEQTALAGKSAWTPAITASVGWQKSRTNLNAAYSRAVTAGGGLLGAYISNNADLSARLRATHVWVLGVDFDYSEIKNVTPTISLGTSGGHRVGGDVLVRRTFGERFGFEVGYNRLHQSYSGIALLAGAPDSNREYGSIFYQIRKPIGQ